MYNKKKILSGFTLIELVVVMLIIGISIGVVGVSINSLRLGSDLQPFVDYFYQKINLYGQEAVLKQEEIGLNFYKNKIEVLHYNQKNINTKWTVTKVITIPKNINFVLKITENDLFRQDLKDVGANPSIIFTSGGQLTPFELRISSSNENMSFIIKGEFSGELSKESIGNKDG